MKFTVRKKTIKTIKVEAASRDEALEKVGGVTKGWKTQSLVTCASNGKQ